MINKPIFGLAGWSGAGKTTLLEKLIAHCVADGMKVAVIKQTHHDVDLDQPGKDSWRHRQAGATEVIVASERRWALLHEAAAPPLDELVSKLSPCDLVWVEGYKHAPIAKLEVHRAANGKGWLYPHDPAIVALASDSATDSALPQFDLNDAAAIYQFIRHYTGV
jgi:molybdopterin-guanine dinucleotide biosynthesis protein B